MNTVAFNKPRRNHFELPHEKKLSCKMGTLVPVFLTEACPGDRMSLSIGHMIRMMPMIAPILDKVDVYMHAWFVPHRLNWDGWEEFWTMSSPTPPVFPYVQFDNSTHTVAESSIPDYFGVPVGGFVGPNFLRVTAMPFASLGRIYNEWYRQQDIQPELTQVDLADSDNTVPLAGAGLLGAPLRRNWVKDYFTSALPFAQKGEAVTLPLGLTAPVNFVGTDDAANVWKVGDPPTQPANGVASLSNATDPLLTRFQSTIGEDLVIDNSASLEVDLTNATAATIEQLRAAIALQAFLEKNARGGTRYIESIYVRFGVKSSDARLQRPEYLGGGRSNILISEVLQTSETTPDGTAQGTMSGHGISGGSSNIFTRFFEEHGTVMVLMSIMPKTSYQNGISRMLQKFNPLDYLEPSFAHLGEQEVKSKELWATGESADNNTFGYQPRYAEYRTIPSSVHGAFRSTLNFWTLTRQFLDRPELNDDFLKTHDDDFERIFAVQDGSDHCLVYLRNQCHVLRALPKFGIPSGLGLT